MLEITTKKLNEFLSKNKIWPLVMVIMAISFIFIQANRTIGIAVFLLTIFILILLCSPILIMQLTNICKEDFRQPFLYYFLYFCVYIFYPILIKLLAIDDYLLEHHLYGNIVSDAQVIFPVTFVIVTISQIVLYKIPQLINIKVQWKALMKIKSFKAYSFLLILFAIFIPLMSNLFEQQIQNDSIIERLVKYVWVVLQFFLIYIAYYLVYYVHHHILFNNLLKKKGLLFYVAGILAVLLLLTPMINLYISIFPVVYSLKLHTIGLSDYILSDINYSFTILTLLISLPFILIIEWSKQAMSITQLQQEKTSSELNLLKQQINPHFFFNTLNNLYSMSLTQEKETPNTIIQLSELMRYVIYKGKDEKVMLKDDIKYIQDYIDLQKIRIHKKLNYSFEFENIDQNIMIPPMLFIILVENAFKHGIEPAENDCFLHLKLEIESGQLIFTCYNSKENTLNEEAGIGLDNLQKRLDLLFEKDYELILKDDVKEYSATLIFSI